MEGATVKEEEVRLEHDVWGWLAGRDGGEGGKWPPEDCSKLSSSSRLLKLSVGMRLLRRSPMLPDWTGPGNTVMARWSTPSDGARSPMEVRHTKESG